MVSCSASKSRANYSWRTENSNLTLCFRSEYCLFGYMFLVFIFFRWSWKLSKISRLGFSSALQTHPAVPSGTPWYTSPSMASGWGVPIWALERHHLSSVDFISSSPTKGLPGSNDVINLLWLETSNGRLSRFLWDIAWYSQICTGKGLAHKFDNSKRHCMHEWEEVELPYKDQWNMENWTQHNQPIAGPPKSIPCTMLACKGCRSTRALNYPISNKEASFNHFTSIDKTLTTI